MGQSMAHHVGQGEKQYTVHGLNALEGAQREQTKTEVFDALEGAQRDEKEGTTTGRSRSNSNDDDDQ